MAEELFAALAAERRDIVARLTLMNAEHLRLEAARAGLELEHDAVRAAAGDDAAPLEGLARRHAEAVARLVALDQERDALIRRLEEIVAQFDLPGRPG